MPGGGRESKPRYPERPVVNDNKRRDKPIHTNQTVLLQKQMWMELKHQSPCLKRAVA